MYDNKFKFAMTFVLFSIIAMFHRIAALFDGICFLFTQDSECLNKEAKHLEGISEMHHYQALMLTH